MGQDSFPTKVASACLADYRGKRILLTVAHATGDQGDWALQVRFAPQQNRTLLRWLGAMNFFAIGNLGSSELKRVDLSFVEIDPSVTAYRQEIDPTKNTIKCETPITVHALTLCEKPDPNDTFGFCGMVLPAQEEHFGQRYFSGEIRTYPELSFLRTEGNYHVFKLPFDHPGHEHFEGCSGAPIINSAGIPVALVCSGCDKHDEIWGISLAAYKVPIDLALDHAAE
ncbi:hypothetical protein GCM10007898_29780 [Dyella flagellata]|uniref:Trypsin-like peptidase domain-containing protein n=2 Tax=Dyella flagellata TaxID=1867833 RepID=A0ABQ5XCQ1_9GAMM|nr:hypothetical protein GCM10007898_29780 [Dyella flagellata]